MTCLSFPKIPSGLGFASWGHHGHGHRQFFRQTFHHVVAAFILLIQVFVPKSSRRFSDSPWRIEGTCMVFSFRPTCFGARRRTPGSVPVQQVELKNRTLCDGVSIIIRLPFFRAESEQNIAHTLARLLRTTDAGMGHSRTRSLMLRS